jgi:hypothetical protein
MTVEKLAHQYAAGSDLYVACFNEDGDVFDFDSNTWVAISLPPVDPFLAPTAEETGTGGDGYSDYWWDIDLGLLNATATEMAVRVKVFEQAGGSPVLADDAVVGISDVSVVSGAEVVVADFTECVFTPAYRAGNDTIYFTAQLRVNGQPVTLAGGDTCTIVVRQINPLAGSNLFTVGPSAPDANGVFTLSQVNPGLNADTVVYRAIITMVVDGVTYTFHQHFPSYA